MTSNGKQITVTSEMLSAVARDQWWPDGGFAFVLFCYVTNHSMTGPLGNSEPVIKCFSLILYFLQDELLKVVETEHKKIDEAYAKADKSQSIGEPSSL